MGRLLCSYDEDLPPWTPSGTDRKKAVLVLTLGADDGIRRRGTVKQTHSSGTLVEGRGRAILKARGTPAADDSSGPQAGSIWQPSSLVTSAWRATGAKDVG